MSFNEFNLSFINNPLIEEIFSCIITVVWIVGVTNAINLIDGLDGLSSGISVISAISLLVIFVLFLASCNNYKNNYEITNSNFETFYNVSSSFSTNGVFRKQNFLCVFCFDGCFIRYVFCVCYLIFLRSG